MAFGDCISAVRVVSEVFRRFQEAIRTAGVWREYRERMTYSKLFWAFGICSVLVGAGATPSAKLPPSGNYEIDPLHTFAYFGASHHVVGLVRGRFDKVTGVITVSQSLGDCSVDVSIDAGSVSTQVTERDEDLRSPAYFDVKKFPKMTYKGRGIRQVSGGLWRMDGSLTILGVTKVVPLTFAFNGMFSDIKPGQPARVAFHATAGTKRGDYGMGSRDKGEVDPQAMADVGIEIDVEADAKGAGR